MKGSCLVCGTYEDGGNNGHVVLGLDALSILLQVGEQRVVVDVEERAGDLLEPREDVSSGGRILATHDARTELAGGVEEVDVVAAHEVLRHAHDGAVQARLETHAVGYEGLASADGYEEGGMTISGE